MDPVIRKAELEKKKRLTDEESLEYFNLLSLEDEQISDAPAESSDEEIQPPQPQVFQQNESSEEEMDIDMDVVQPADMQMDAANGNDENEAEEPLAQLANQAAYITRSGV